jgi:hypothetical protein
MRFMMIMRPGAKAETGIMPGPEVFEAMTRYNEDLQKAGVLLAGEGLHPSSKGARITFSGGKPTVTDGPFAEAKEVIGGFWLIEVKSKAEAVEWASRCPAGDDEAIEIRQIYEAADFPPEAFSPELAAREKALFEKARKAAAKP